MNTIDIKYNGEIKDWDQLLTMAREQFVHYETVEGLDWDKYDFSIDCAYDQAKFKDIIQIRFIEELTEASVAINEEDEHFWEEIGDSINFFLSAYCMIGDLAHGQESPDHFLCESSIKMKPDHDTFGLAAYEVIEAVGYLCNLLKNRPWAQSNYLVSIYDFKERLRKLWCVFWAFLGDMGLSKEDVFEMFYKKYMVNKHRIETKY